MKHVSQLIEVAIGELLATATRITNQPALQYDYKTHSFTASFQQGQALPAEAFEQYRMIQVQRGSVLVQIGNEVRRLMAGVTHTIPPGVVHRIVAETSGALRLWYAKTPANEQSSRQFSGISQAAPA